MNIINYFVSYTNSSILISLLVLLTIFRLCTASFIYLNSKSKNNKSSIAFVALALFFPIIASIAYRICIKKNIQENADVNCNRHKKISVIFLICSIISIVLSIFVFSLAYISAVNNAYDYLNKGFDNTCNATKLTLHNDLTKKSVQYYDLMGNKYQYLQDVVYYDSKGNRYISDYETVHSIDNDDYYSELFCYVDKNGYFYYDANKIVTVKDKHSCVDDKGEIFYPLSFVRFSKDGEISCDLPSVLYYDKYNCAYVSDNAVPFYDNDNNKLFYSFNANTQKGQFSSVNGNVNYDSNKCFVDSKGNFFFDEKNRIAIGSKERSINELTEYFDESGNLYYRAADIIWDNTGKITMRW